MNIQLSSEVRRSMKERKLVSLTTSYKRKLNLLVIGSNFLPFPVYVIRCNRKEVLRTTNLLDAIGNFNQYAFDCVVALNELPLE